MQSAKAHPNFVSPQLVSHNCEDVTSFKPNLSPNGVKNVLAKCTSLTSPAIALTHTHTHKHTRTQYTTHARARAHTHTCITVSFHQQKSQINGKKVEINGVAANAMAVKGHAGHIGHASTVLSSDFSVTQFTAIISSHNSQVISHGNDTKERERE